MADAQRRQNYSEACRWSYLADRERAISKWESEQAITFRARQALDLHTSVARHRDLRLNALETKDSEWLKSDSPSGSSTWAAKDARLTETSGTSELKRQPTIEMPVNLMDRSQSIVSEAANASYTLFSNDQMQTFNLPHIPQGNDLAASSNLLARSNSIQRHIPATSLRMAPTPLRPRIDHHTLSYPIPQASRLSFIQPAEAPAPIPAQNSLDSFGYTIGSGTDGSSSNQTAISIPSLSGATVSVSIKNSSSLCPAGAHNCF